MSAAPDWRRSGVDTTQIMAEFREHMARISAEKEAASLMVCHGAFIRRKPDLSLLEFDRLHELMLPTCSEPFAAPVRRLAKLSIMFMQTSHYKRGVELGWTYQDFFGVPAVDLRDARPRGLLPTLAWTKFAGKVRGIDHEGCKIAVTRSDGTISAMQMWRPHPAPGTVPFWESKGLDVL